MFSKQRLLIVVGWVVTIESKIVIIYVFGVMLAACFSNRVLFRYGFKHRSQYEILVKIRHFSNIVETTAAPFRLNRQGLTSAAFANLNFNLFLFCAIWFDFIIDFVHSFFIFLDLSYDHDHDTTQGHHIRANLVWDDKSKPASLLFHVPKVILGPNHT